MSVTKYHELSRYVALPILLLALSGCQTISGWFGGNDSAEKPAALIEFSPTATLHGLWQAAAGSAGSFVLQPALVGDGIYTAARDGQLQRLDANNGRQIWHIDSGHKLSAGVGAHPALASVGPVPARRVPVSQSRAVNPSCPARRRQPPQKHRLDS